MIITQRQYYCQDVFIKKLKTYKNTVKTTRKITPRLTHRFEILNFIEKNFNYGAYLLNVCPNIITKSKTNFKCSLYTDNHEKTILRVSIIFNKIHFLEFILLICADFRVIISRVIRA